MQVLAPDLDNWLTVTNMQGPMYPIQIELFVGHVTSEAAVSTS